MNEVVELIEMVTGTISAYASSDVVVGDPIDFGAVTVVPLSRISIGYGGGGGHGEGNAGPGSTKKKRRSKGKGTGSGGGGGVTIRPIGVAVFGESGVKVIPIPDKPTLLERVFDAVPDLVDMAKGAVERSVKKIGADKE